jgi:hypothetical protein
MGTPARQCPLAVLARSRLTCRADEVLATGPELARTDLLAGRCGPISRRVVKAGRKLGHFRRLKTRPLEG